MCCQLRPIGFPIRDTIDVITQPLVLGRSSLSVNVCAHQWKIDLLCVFSHSGESEIKQTLSVSLNPH